MKSTVFAAFESRNYRLYFFGQSFSLVGTWMQRTAVYWLVYEQTRSAFALGTTVFFTQFPSFMFSMLGGVASDRYNRFRVLMSTQIASLIQALLMTFLVFYDDYGVWQLLGLSAVLGAINAFDIPARQALVYDMVENKQHLPNAIALNSSMINAARLIGPALSGFTLEKLGAGICFLSNAISFLVVIFSMTQMRLPAFIPKARVHSVMEDLKEGYHYLKVTPEINRVMLMLACVSFIALPYVTLLPVYARDIFSGSASTFGVLNSFVGLGAVAGALFLASLKPGTNLKKMHFFCTLIFGSGLIAFAYMKIFSVALVCIAFAGFGMMSQTTLSNTIIQTTVAPAMRGRVISYYAMAFFGMQPIGGLITGFTANRIGAPLTILVIGILTALIALIFFPFLHPGGLLRKQRIKMKQIEEQVVENS